MAKERLPGKTYDRWKRPGLDCGCVRGGRTWQLKLLMTFYKLPKAETLLRLHLFNANQSLIPPNCHPAPAVQSCVALDKTLNLSESWICHL